MSTVPNSFAPFDWVSERAKCTPFTVFEVLRQQVQRDTEIRIALNAQVPAYKNFKFQSEPQFFAVIYTDAGINKGVKFNIGGNGVVAHDIESGKPLLDGILTLSNDGQCRLKVTYEGIGQIECDLWQFRKMALHDLFFVNKEVVP